MRLYKLIRSTLHKYRTEASATRRPATKTSGVSCDIDVHRRSTPVRKGTTNNSNGRKQPPTLKCQLAWVSQQCHVFHRAQASTGGSDYPHTTHPRPAEPDKIKRNAACFVSFLRGLRGVINNTVSFFVPPRHPLFLLLWCSTSAG